MIEISIVLTRFLFSLLFTSLVCSLEIHTLPLSETGMQFHGSVVRMMFSRPHKIFSSFFPRNNLHCPSIPVFISKLCKPDKYNITKKTLGFNILKWNVVLINNILDIK